MADPQCTPVLDRLRVALEMFELGERVMREQLRRRFPGAGDDEIGRRLVEWLRSRPAGEIGDVAGPVRLREMPPR